MLQTGKIATAMNNDTRDPRCFLGANACRCCSVHITIGALAHQDFSITTISVQNRAGVGARRDGVVRPHGRRFLGFCA